MAAAGGTWSKGQFKPAQNQKKVSSATVASSNSSRAQTAPAKAPPATTARPIPGNTPAQQAEYLRTNSKQTAMFSQGEDSPLFSGTAQRATVDPFKKKVVGRQERFDGGPTAVRENPLARKQEDNPRNRFTPEYFSAKDEREYTEKNGEFYPGELEEIKDREASERDISRAARERGYTPGKMSQKDWSTLSDTLRYEANSDLKTATQFGRDGLGNKAVGRRTRNSGDDRQFVEVGGRTVERKWKGGSEKEAREATARINRDSRAKADDYMVIRLKDFGFNDTDNMSYGDKKKLFVEIGQGKTQYKGRLAGMTQSERQQRIDATIPSQREKALLISDNPRAAKGIDKWGLYEVASVKAGKNPDPLPYQIFD